MPAGLHFIFFVFSLTSYISHFLSQTATLQKLLCPLAHPVAFFSFGTPDFALKHSPSETYLEGINGVAVA